MRCHNTAGAEREPGRVAENRLGAAARCRYIYSGGGEQVQVDSGVLRRNCLPLPTFYERDIHCTQRLGQGEGNIVLYLDTVPHIVIKLQI